MEMTNSILDFKGLKVESLLTSEALPVYRAAVEAMDIHNDIPITFDFGSPEIVGELKDKRFIVKSFRKPHWFSVNPLIVWKGSWIEREDIVCIINTLRMDYRLNINKTTQQ
jgi:hypothetical protein